MTSLPPGQQLRESMPPFGLPWYAPRLPRGELPVRIRVTGAGVRDFTIDAATLAGLVRVEQVSDFHCATTWSVAGVRWGGVPFRAVYEQLLLPVIADPATVTHVRFTGADGYRDTSALEDLLVADVLLADHLDGRPLTRAHGAPIRLVAPAHYGYKSVKYLAHVTLLGPRHWRAPVTLHHPRARVAHEERTRRLGRRSAGLLTRWLVRPWTIRLFARVTRSG